MLGLLFVVVVDLDFSSSQRDVERGEGKEMAGKVVGGTLPPPLIDQRHRMFKVVD